MRPKFSQLGRAHDLPKIHNYFDTPPSFRPMVDTTNITSYRTGKFLAKLLNRLTQNEYSVKGSSKAVEKIHKIPVELFDQGY